MRPLAYTIWFAVIVIITCIATLPATGLQAQATDPPQVYPAGWYQRSSTDGDLVVDGPQQQTASLVLDIDNDGLNDFVIGGRRAAPAMVWYRNTGQGWERYIMDDATLNIEAGGAFADIDRDGDLDVVMGEDSNGNHIYWWENPYPDYDPATTWNRYEIKNSGGDKHHDQMFGNFDDDPEPEFVFWNQDIGSPEDRLFLADIPADPQNTQPWPYTEIFAGSSGDYEGLASADIDGDGKDDIIGAGLWFKHEGGTTFTPNVIDGESGRTFTRSAAGQLIAGGRPEVVIGPGDNVGRLKLYTWNEDSETWDSEDLLGFDVDHGHSLDIVDINDDGYLDIFVAEMRLNSDNDDAKMWALLGDGQGNFTVTVIAEGYGNHESRVADLDGDGDLDVLGKPYNWDTPRVDLWFNTTTREGRLQLNRWQRHVIDEDKPWRALFITAADIDDDNEQDIITGGWWYKNPGEPGGTWTRSDIGDPLNNMAAVQDFDGDGSPDVLGTEGKGSESNDALVWARNDGSGSFTILDNIAEADGDFLQGVAVAPLQGSAYQVALSWHIAGKGVQVLDVPADPVNTEWPWQQLSPVSQDEALSVGDIDRDGDNDLLLGTQWLRNDGDTWSEFTLYDSGSDLPDRNRLGDINGDERLDSVVGYEKISQLGKLAWYEQGETATDPWQEHIIATVIGPMSLDVADMDRDGDMDVVVGEHNTDNPDSARLYVFENIDGQGTEWARYLVYEGDEHHDGTQLVDIDSDGDLDIISIGWTHGRVLVYENTGFFLKIYLPLLMR